jgi:hypothetical protein
MPKFQLGTDDQQTDNRGRGRAQQPDRVEVAEALKLAVSALSLLRSRRRSPPTTRRSIKLYRQRITPAF